MKRFFSDSKIPEDPKVLLVQTANPNLTDIVLDQLIQKYGSENITFYRQRGMENYLKKRPSIKVIENPQKGRLKAARHLRRQKYDLAAMILSGEKGFWKLKTLPFYCNPKSIVLFNRIGESRKFSGQQMIDWILGKNAFSSHSLGYLKMIRLAFAPVIFIFLTTEYLLRRSEDNPAE